ncbi:hypothetical protein FRC11_002447, partial [Ceratobasidium sp. 423]
MHKHIAKKHKEMLATLRADANRNIAKGQVARDRYTTSTPAMRGLPIGEVEHWTNDQTHQLEALQAQYIESLDNA